MKNINDIYINLKASFGVMFQDVKFELRKNSIYAYNINNKDNKIELTLTEQKKLYEELMSLAYYKNEDKKVSFEEANDAYYKYKFNEAKDVDDLKNKYNEVISDLKNNKK